MAADTEIAASQRLQNSATSQDSPAGKQRRCATRATDPNSSRSPAVRSDTEWSDIEKGSDAPARAPIARAGE